MPVLAGGDHVFSADGSRPLGGFDDRKKDFDKACGVSGCRCTICGGQPARC